MKMSKTIRWILAVTLIFHCFMSTSFASNSPNDYFRFTSPNSRINSDGSFEFRFYVSVTSDTFIATSNTLTVQTRVTLYNMATQAYEIDPEFKFSLILYKNDFLTTEVDGYVGCADGVYGGKTFTVEPGEEYYFRLWRYDDRNVGTGKYFDGYGNATPISLVTN